MAWLCPLKYTLEPLSVNEVDSGLMIQDTLQGVLVNVSASLIMQLVSVQFISQVSMTLMSAMHSCLDLV